MAGDVLGGVSCAPVSGISFFSNSVVFFFSAFFSQDVNARIKANKANEKAVSFGPFIVRCYLSKNKKFFELAMVS
jgi:hypothetical protein